MNSGFIIIIETFFTASVNTTTETIIITIHLEQDWEKLPANSRSATHCSPYMRELTQFIARVHHTYLAPYENKEMLTTK